MRAASSRRASKAVAEGPPAGSPDLSPILADGVVHDLKNPLNAFSLYLELLDTALAPFPEAAARIARHRDALRKQVGRMDAILRRFRRFAAPAASEAQEDIDLGELVAQAVEVCGFMARRRGLEVGTSLEDVVVRGEAASVTQAVLRALMEAILVGSPGGTIEVSAGRRDGEGVVRISAAGDGALKGEVRLALASCGSARRAAEPGR